MKNNTIFTSLLILFILLGSINTAVIATPSEYLGPVFLGNEAGVNESSYSQSGNVGIGDYSLSMNTTGFQNTAVGGNALANNITGNENTAVGINSLMENKASYNMAIGTGALRFNTTGPSNTAVGTYSLIHNTTGNGNIALGFGAGGLITTGSKNIIIGYDVNPPSITGSNQLNIGNTIYGDTLAGNINIRNNLTAKKFIGDGSGLTNISVSTVNATNATNLVGLGSISGIHTVTGTLNFASGSVISGDLNQAIGDFKTAGNITAKNSTGTAKTMTDLLSMVPRATQPATAVAGDIYTSNKGGGIAICAYSGTAWVKIGGTATCPG